MEYEVFEKGFLIDEREWGYDETEEHVGTFLLQESAGIERRMVGERKGWTASEIWNFAQGRSAGGQMSASRRVTNSQLDLLSSISSSLFLQ